jgi:hypothetical protein
MRRGASLSKNLRSRISGGSRNFLDREQLVKSFSPQKVREERKFLFDRKGRRKQSWQRLELRNNRQLKEDVAGEMAESEEDEKSVSDAGESNFSFGDMSHSLMMP